MGPIMERPRIAAPLEGVAAALGAGAGLPTRMPRWPITDPRALRMISMPAMDRGERVENACVFLLDGVKDGG